MGSHNNLGFKECVLKIGLQMKRTYIIAELSANHNNDFALAVRTLGAMAKAGADAVKIQTYRAESLSLDCRTGLFAPRESGLWSGSTPWEIYSEAAMPYEWQPLLQSVAEDLGMDFFSSPFDLEAVEFLESMNIVKYKIASPEINDLPLIRRVAKTGKPIIMSTGLATEADIRTALAECWSVGNQEITLLKCTSQYPASLDQANLATIPDMKAKFQTDVGVSDHTLGDLVPTLAVALGAVVVEKHFILDRALGGPDSAFSMEPIEFKNMVDVVRQVESAMGNVVYDLSEEDKMRRRSLFVVKDIAEGELLTSENVRSIRPGHGMAPSEIENVLNRTALRLLKKGVPLSKEDFD